MARRRGAAAVLHAAVAALLLAAALLAGGPEPARAYEAAEPAPRQPRPQRRRATLEDVTAALRGGTASQLSSSGANVSTRIVGGRPVRHARRRRSHRCARRRCACGPCACVVPAPSQRMPHFCSLSRCLF
jgi:hypothetical protein